ncbi:MAG: Nif3-like dinuclear metal center hexameric protein [Clostridia bacterium]|nr:Nif3-like dinuclear metal center hexameric protein [Clostridia bacterium]MBR6524127.1 Nif3-like dinuclear metal center hexameric protein [Clostridia bacterium]
MIRLSNIMEELEKIAPSELKFPWDNVGLLVGDEAQKISRVFVCLDITAENVKAAAEFGADLIVSHHPLIFEPLRSVTASDVTGSIVRELIKNNISAFCMHTSFDMADGGMNDLLAQKLGLENVRKFTAQECIDTNGEKLDGIGRVGSLDVPQTMEDFLEQVKDALCCKAIKYTGDLDDRIQTVALCSGSGGSEMYAAYHSGADVYVTADLKHDHGRIASEIGLNMIDAGHFETENIICLFLADFFFQHFPELEVKISDAKPYFNNF